MHLPFSIDPESKCWGKILIGLNGCCFPATLQLCQRDSLRKTAALTLVSVGK